MRLSPWRIQAELHGPDFIEPNGEVGKRMFLWP
jgi:hypothetical protein